MSIGIKSKFTDEILGQLRDMQTQQRNMGAPAGDAKSGGTSFSDMLMNGVKEVDSMQKTSDKMGTAIATGQSQNLHETMLATTQSELSFNLMVQVRNRVLEAYQEVMRMPV